MSRLDRYVLSELVPPFLFGVGAFLVVLVGVDLLSDVLKLIYRQGFPPAAAAKIFLLQLPGLVTLSLPMAMLFGSLMATARLSGDGEIVAMRAGGTSFPRIGVTVVIVGLLVSGGALAINETLVPAFNSRAFEIARRVRETVASPGDLAFEVRGEDGRLQRWLHAETFDPQALTMTEATIVDFSKGGHRHLFTAESAKWEGEAWVLANLEHKWRTADGLPQEERADRLAIHIGRTVQELERIKKDPEDMTLAEARAQAALAKARGDVTQAGKLIQHIHIRIAVPWCSLGFAVLGLPLGLRRLRSSRSIGLGLSLVIIFAYYVVLHTLSILGERGAGNPALMAWAPNVLLYLVGFGLLANSSR